MNITDTRAFALALAASTLVLTSACGEAYPADAEAVPDETVDIVALDRDTPNPSETPDIVGTVDANCRAQLAEPFIGQELGLNTRTALLEAVSPQVTTRFIEDGEEIDEDDVDTDRLNIRTDDEGMISEVFCG